MRRRQTGPLAEGGAHGVVASDTLGLRPHVLEIGGEIDVYTAPRLRERLIEMVDAGENQVVIDLGRVEFLDSTGLGVLVGAHRRLRCR